MPRRVDAMFKAFADETRVRILSLLIHGELCVCDIVKTLHTGQSKISRHLAYLKKAGLVVDRKDGLWRHYSLATPQSKFHQGLLSCVKECFEEVEILKKDRKALKKSMSRC